MIKRRDFSSGKRGRWFFSLFFSSCHIKFIDNGHENKPSSCFDKSLGIQGLSISISLGIRTGENGYLN